MTWNAEALFGPQRPARWGMDEPDSFYGMPPLPPDEPEEPRVIVQRQRMRGEQRGRLLLLARDGERSDLGGQAVTFDAPPCAGQRFLVRVANGKPYELARVVASRGSTSGRSPRFGRRERENEARRRRDRRRASVAQEGWTSESAGAELPLSSRPTCPTTAAPV